MVKHIPQGQLNKNQVVFKRLKNLMKDLGKKYSIRVGIMGDEAYQQHEYTDLTMAELGAIHEFGATTGAGVVIPTRSFLRMPLLSAEGKKELRKIVNKNLGKDREFNLLEAVDNEIVLSSIAELIAVTALERVQQAFEGSGFGNWPPVTKGTIAHRRSNKDNDPLHDTGDLWDSITAIVKSENSEVKLRISGPNA